MKCCCSSTKARGGGGGIEGVEQVHKLVVVEEVCESEGVALQRHSPSACAE